MLNTNVRQPFSLEEVFTVHRPFQCNGVWYANGDDFPASEVKDERRLRKMYEARFINFKLQLAKPAKELSKELLGNKETNEELTAKQKRRLARLGRA